MIKYTKHPDENLNITIDLGLADSITASAVSGSTCSVNTLTVNSVTINNAEVVVNGVTLSAGKAIVVALVGGTNLQEYKIVVTLSLSDSTTKKIEVIVIVSSIEINYYGSTNHADDYFGLKISTDSWGTSTEIDKVRALTQATNAIDRLNFSGEKANSSQVLQFPRDTDKNVPVAIERACYEEAFRLLDGTDPEREKANLSAISRGFASVRTTYDRTAVPENILSGITSSIAWAYLYPYLRDPGELDISRV